MIYHFLYYASLFVVVSVISNRAPKNMKGDLTAGFQGQYN